jgi:hypothetical protein
MTLPIGILPWPLRGHSSRDNVTAGLATDQVSGELLQHFRDLFETQM